MPRRGRHIRGARASDQHSVAGCRSRCLHTLRAAGAQPCQVATKGPLVRQKRGSKLSSSRPRSSRAGGRTAEDAARIRREQIWAATCEPPRDLLRRRGGRMCRFLLPTAVPCTDRTERRPRSLARPTAATRAPESKGPCAHQPRLCGCSAAEHTCVWAGVHEPCAPAMDEGRAGERPRQRARATRRDMLPDPRRGPSRSEHAAPTGPCRLIISLRGAQGDPPQLPQGVLKSSNRELGSILSLSPSRSVPPT